MSQQAKALALGALLDESPNFFEKLIANLDKLGDRVFEDLENDDHCLGRKDASGR